MNGNPACDADGARIQGTSEVEAAPLADENPERGLFCCIHAEKIPGREPGDGRTEAVRNRYG